MVHSFHGEDCIWQFWRFHSEGVTEEWGLALRVRRTQGVENRFREPGRWVGLERVGSRDDAWYVIVWGSKSFFVIKMTRKGYSRVQGYMCVD